MIKYIAEVGINHNGSLSTAKGLIDLAARSGCHAVKFQKRTIDTVYTTEFLDSYRESPWGTTQRKQKEALEFNQDDYEQIDAHCRKKGIIWFASAWDLASLRFLEQFSPPYKKIASVMLSHDELVNEVIRLPGKALVSTGGAKMPQIASICEQFNQDASPFVLFHCVPTYPCADENCHISKIPFLMDNLGLDEIGYSGHEVGVLPSVLAVANGATWIERHITLDRSMYGSDQAASLEPRGLELMIKYCDSVAAVMGNEIQGDFISAEAIAVINKLRYWG